MKNIRSQIFGGDGGSAPTPLVASKRKLGASGDAGLVSVPVPRSEVRTSDTRDSDRHRISEHSITADHGTSSHEVQLINLSGGGAMINAGFSPNLWDRVDLHLGDQTVECAVRWIKGERIGLEFAHETRIDCSPEQQDALLREVLSRCFQSPAEATVVPEATESSAEPQSPVESRRGYQRHPLIWTGTIHYDHDSYPVRLRNISARGALVETSTPVPEGAELLLDLAEAGSLFATVSWTAGDQIGLTFQSPFDITRLAKVRPEVAPARWEQPDYLKQSGAKDSPWASQWARLSVEELKAELDGKKR